MLAHKVLIQQVISYSTNKIQELFVRLIYFSNALITNLTKVPQNTQP